MHSPPLLLGHRGARASDSVPENTFESFDLALRHGCQGFEFDVRLTACGRAVICHDPEVNGVKVAAAGCEQLRDLPQLGEVLARYGGRAFLDIELKVPGLASQVLVAISEHSPQRGYVVSSFLPNVLTDLRQRSAVLSLGLICDKRQQLEGWREMPVQYLILHHSLIRRQLVDEVHNAGRSLLAWTVNEEAVMRQLADWGVDGIISDATELLVRTLGLSPM